MTYNSEEKKLHLRALDTAIDHITNLQPVSRLGIDWSQRDGFTLINDHYQPVAKHLTPQAQNYFHTLHAAADSLIAVMVTARACLASLDHGPHSGYIKQGLSIATAINKTRKP